MMVKKWRLLFSFSILLIVCCSLCSCQTNDPLNRIAGEIPIQHNGRVKSFDLFAQETVQFLTGKETWQKKSATFFILDILDAPEEVLDIPCIRIDYIELKEILKLPSEEKFFSYRQLEPSLSTVTSFVRSARDKRDNDVSLSTVEEKAETLYNRFFTVELLSSGKLIKVIPPSHGDAWESPYQSTNPLAADFKRMMTLYAAGSLQEFSQAASQWVEKVSSLSEASLRTKIRMEIVYARIRPFHYSWILYGAAFFVLVFFRKRALMRIFGTLTLFIGFLLHTAGLVLRALILSRPPVANMYESMVFMDWILLICAVVLFLIMKKDFFLTTGALASAFVMLYADILPIDQTLDVLVPILRSNFWLTVHVMTIMSSYSLFGFAMAFGHRHLFRDALLKFDKDTERSSARIINHFLQVGLIALGVGTVLGGVWAFEAWGRFWGWDPKETWALITFIGYMAVIHLRFTGRLNDFWLAVSAILGFLLVAMTWYGVNFILGKGLHSYGSGASGLSWIIYYIVFEFCFFLFVLIKKKQRQNALKKI